MTLTSRKNTVATRDDEQTKPVETGLTARPGGLTATHTKTGRTASSGGRTAPPGLNQNSSLEIPKPSGNFKRIELLTGSSKNYETKCRRITIPSYTLYSWPRAKLTNLILPVRPPANGRSDRQQQKPKNQIAFGGRTATRAGRTARYLTAPVLFRKRVFSQTINAIAN